MFLPLYDNNYLRHVGFQYVTVLLIAANVAIFLLQSTGVGEAAVASFAVIPREILAVGWLGGAANGPLDRFAVPEPYTLVTYMFFHGDMAHLLGNMMFLWVFGDNVEDAVGHLKFLLFYILCGVAAAVTHTLITGDSPRPLIGASGAVAGVIAAYLMLHPRITVWVLALKILPLQITAAIALGLWIAIQVVMVFLPQVGPVAWWAHIGGLVAGAVLILFFRRRGVPLFDRARADA
ncbi:MAG: rhomboid family intramembrane serine protease [Pseudomonadota bacterium]